MIEFQRIYFEHLDIVNASKQIGAIIAKRAAVGDSNGRYQYSLYAFRAVLDVVRASESKERIFRVISCQILVRELEKEFRQPCKIDMPAGEDECSAIAEIYSLGLGYVQPKENCKVTIEFSDGDKILGSLSVPLLFSN